MCIISTAQQARPLRDKHELACLNNMNSCYIPKVIGHIEPCRAQFTTLSSVDNTYSEQKEASYLERVPYEYSYLHSPALFCGVSKLNWLEPRMAMWVTGSSGFVEWVETSGGGADECTLRDAEAEAHSVL